MSDIARRSLIVGGAGLLAGVGMFASGTARAATPSSTVAWDFSFPAIDEGMLKFADMKGRVLLVTNTASFCGFTYQYEGLEKLHAQLTPQGFDVIGIPSQDFGQESADNATVKGFCDATFGVKFPMTGLLHVKGEQADPFYKWVKAERNWQPGWNFNKVLIGRDGRIKGTFGSNDEPTGAALREAIATELKA
jgi:glutathione peroxidase